MSECPFCKAEVPQDASVCRGCGAEKIQGYVSQQTIKFLVIVGTILGIPAGFIVAFITKSTPLMVVTLLLLMLGPVVFLKLKNKNKMTWVRPTVR